LSRENKHGIMFLNHGISHLERLITSLWSLRKVAKFDGPVAVADTGSSCGVIDRIAADDRLGVSVIPLSAFDIPLSVVRAGLWRHSPFQVTVLAHSDTVFAAPLDPLFDILDNKTNPPVLVTHFADWVTTQTNVAKVLKPWVKVIAKQGSCFERAIRVKHLVRESLDASWAAINTGIIGFRGDPHFCGQWERLTAAGVKVFTGHGSEFSDRIAAQLLIRAHRHTLVSDRYNCSVKSGKEVSKAVVWHFHGGRHLESEVWQAAYADAMAANAGGIAGD
jgi:hypothetical protein